MIQGMLKVLRLSLNPKVVSYEELAKLFFETHDPAQVNRQGSDIGEQYRSEIFFFNNEQKITAEKLIKILKDKGYRVATKVTKATMFWNAEKYHQDYYNKTDDKPYCHAYTKRF